MNVDELRKRRKQLEQKLVEMISAEINLFRKETGFSVDSIYVNLVEVTTYAQKERDFIVGNVDCNVAI